MAAPKGNQFWKKRAKHGRDRIFQSPKQLWESACEYFEYMDKNPWKSKELMRSGDLAGELVDVPTARPYSLEGLCLYLGANSKYWAQFKLGLPEAKTLDKEQKEAFSNVITQIEAVIRVQKMEGATVGAFNHNIIARELGLVDKTETQTQNTHVNYNVELTKTEIQDINKSLEEDY